jgi:hypothetical protein
MSDIKRYSLSYSNSTRLSAKDKKEIEYLLNIATETNCQSYDLIRKPGGVGLPGGIQKYKIERRDTLTFAVEYMSLREPGWKESIEALLDSDHFKITIQHKDQVDEIYARVPCLPNETASWIKNHLTNTNT